MQYPPPPPHTAPATRPSHDKRRAVRNMVSGKPTTLYRCINGGAGEQLTVKLVDFSPHGAGFVFPAEVEIGQQFLYPLYQRAGAEVYMLYTVVRTSPAPDGHHAGCELTCIFPAADLRLATPPLAPQLDTIRRAILD